MPRIVTETWLNVGVDITTEDYESTVDGVTAKRPHPVIVIVDTTPFGQHVVKVPIDDNAKETLLRKLTSGVIVPTKKLPTFPR